MEKLKGFATKRPILFSAVIIVLGIVLTEIPLKGLLAPYVGVQPAHYIALIVEQGLTGALFFYLLARFGWLKAGGFTPLWQWRAVWLGWPLVIFTLLNASEFIGGPMYIDFSKPGLLALHLLTALSTGWVEEVMGRGLVLVAMLKTWGRSKRGIYAAVLTSSVLFGLAHLANFIAGRKPMLNSLTQVAFSLFFGVIFAACMLRNRSIWPMIVLHAAVDWGATLPEVAIGGGLRTVAPLMTPANALASILITLPLLIYGLFILRKVEPALQDPEIDVRTLPTSSPVAIS
jgi:membrane protease YdiL (CAAX protease family)